MICYSIVFILSPLFIFLSVFQLYLLWSGDVYNIILLLQSSSCYLHSFTLLKQIYSKTPCICRYNFKLDISLNANHTRFANSSVSDLLITSWSALRRWCAHTARRTSLSSVTSTLMSAAATQLLSPLALLISVKADRKSVHAEATGVNQSQSPKVDFENRAWNTQVSLKRFPNTGKLTQTHALLIMESKAYQVKSNRNSFFFSFFFLLQKVARQYGVWQR